jgi:acetamidase/formamidase
VQTATRSGRGILYDAYSGVPTHRLGATSATTTDVFDAAIPPRLIVAPGDTLIVESLDARGYLEPQTVPGEARPRMFGDRRGLCLAGPIGVHSALPGQVLAVEILSMRPGPWGWTLAAAFDNRLTRRLGVAEGPPAWLLWEIDADAATAVDHLGHKVALSPFLGAIGLPPVQPGPHSTLPPRAEGGGNIDCRELVAGSTLYLPVTVPGALLCVGDGHAAQGDGEVCVNAIETGLIGRFRLTVRDDMTLAWPRAETPTHVITMAFDPDLDDCVVVALRQMLDLIESRTTLRRHEAYMLASLAADLRVTQVVNDYKGIHVMLEKGYLQPAR